MKNLGYGDNYKYAHDFEGNFAEQEFMPEPPDTDPVSANAPKESMA